MPDFRHLIKMTTRSGILQFSQHQNPDPSSGYTLDDNARALLVFLKTKTSYPEIWNYINYLYTAQQPDGTWFNFLLNDQFSSRFDSEDSIGRAILACSMGALSTRPEIRNVCSLMIEKSLPRARHFTSPRGVAYVLIALCKGHVPHLNNQQRRELVNRLSSYLMRLYRHNHFPGWYWYEDCLTYCNGIIPHALLCVYALNNDKQALKVGRESLDFLNSILFRDGYLNIIGNQGWYYRGDSIPLFDQQPVDAASIALACLEGYKVVGKSEYHDLAILAHAWYRGTNIHGVSLYDELTGGCCDALTAEGVNLNQGAEAVVSMLLTDLAMEESETILIPAEQLS
ncbi:MAG: hypothetical protein ACOX6I_08100 [Syntrophomonadaceae bacterium]|jgi:hypothetical protein